MTIVNGAVNYTVPDLQVQILPPTLASLNGVPTNVLGVVGTAPWGPKNSPTPFSSMADYQRLFSGIVARKFDMGTIAATAVQQGANNFRGVRVTDGTDTAATIVVQTNCLTLTSFYTGSGANGDTVSIGPGSQANSYKVVVSRAGLAPEVFDNLAVGLTGAAIWAAIAAALNTGISSQRAASQYVVASAGVGTTAPATATYTLAGGTDGAAVTATMVLGADGSPRTGLYALRGTGAAIGVLADCDASSTWSAQVAYGLSEGTYMIAVGPAGEFTNPATVATNKQTAGIDAYAIKLLVGDWCYWSDPVAGVRLVSPQGFAAGLLANIGPQESGLNKPLFGVVATQKSFANQAYAQADLGIFGAAGLDMIANPCPGGAFFGLRFGSTASSNPAVRDDTYPRLTNFLAQTINLGMGQQVGKLQTPDQRREAANALGGLLDGLWNRGIIGNASGSQPYLVTLNDTNNPASQVAQGIELASVQVQYLGVIRTFLVNLTGGQTVTLPSAVAA